MTIGTLLDVLPLDSAECDELVARAADTAPLPPHTGVFPSFLAIASASMNSLFSWNVFVSIPSDSNFWRSSFVPIEDGSLEASALPPLETGAFPPFLAFTSASMNSLFSRNVFVSIPSDSNS